jgi:hypothetical protein
MHDIEVQDRYKDRWLARRMIGVLAFEHGDLAGGPEFGHERCWEVRSVRLETDRLKGCAETLFEAEVERSTHE